MKFLNNISKSIKYNLRPCSNDLKEIFVGTRTGVFKVHEIEAYETKFD
jgi:hypothetical protein